MSAKKSHPHRGSVQFWPRVRSKKHCPSIRTHPTSKDPKPLGFIAYKAGMTHIMYTNTAKKGNPEASMPVTVLECPPLKPFSIRFYKNTTHGFKILAEIFNKKVEKELERKTKTSKKETKEPENYDYIRLSVYTQPKLTGIGKKRPDVLEIALGGSKEEQLKLAKELLEKQITINDVAKEGEFLDIHSVTKGKGFQGTVKRFGVKIMQHKAEKKKRGIGTLGPWHPNKVPYTVPQPGKMGYHRRTHYNFKVIKIGDKPEEINPKSGFLRYGLIKNPYILIKGSIAGAAKRPIVLTPSIRCNKQPQPTQITYISLESKQG